ncbi:MAG TPA: HAMP domain-containing sensor histidine kinase [Mycobacteriales bacterium]|nr:HAMP domain-containing sensor histidine kinase [Mycobacteriales bacterium]
MNALRGLAARTPLRVKLVATVLVLAAAGLSIAAVAATASLHSYLIGRVDDQLQVAARGIADGFRFRLGLGGVGGPVPVAPLGAEGEGSTTSTGPEGGVAQGGRLPSPYYVRFYSAEGSPKGSPDAAPLTAQSPPRLPSRLDGALVHSGKPFDVPAADGAGSWRVVVVPARDQTGAIAIATSLSDVNRTVEHLILLEVLIGAAALVLMAGSGYLLIRRSLNPLVAVEHTAEAIAAGDLSQRVPELHPRTEVGRVSNALNVMLTRIEDAFARQRTSEQHARASEERMRQFIADASHELRTPLTSIRGFAELHRIGGADAADVSDSMARIEGEAERMGLLVDDLLLLARLDQERPLERAPVDLLDIAHEVVANAKLVAPDRAIDLTADAPVPPIVMGDATRLRQVVDNLMRNALIHTPANAAVRVKVVADEASRRALVEVADDGPGMDEVDAVHVFERFYRADQSRTRSAEAGGSKNGSGLGLSIVASLVAAHGGTAAVATRPGEGATFRIDLPLAD